MEGNKEHGVFIDEDSGEWVFSVLNELSGLEMTAKIRKTTNWQRPYLQLIDAKKNIFFHSFSSRFYPFRFGVVVVEWTTLKRSESMSQM